MALTITVVKQSVFGDQRIAFADVEFDDSYPTGGEPFDLEEIGLQTSHFMAIEPADGYIVEYDRENGKLIVRTPTNAASGDAEPAAPADEVTSGTDLSSLSVRVMGIGY